jgi:hypothetical protein
MSEPLQFLIDALASFAPRLGLDLFCAFVLIQGIYVKLYPRREYAFTYWLLNLITFSVAYMLSGVRVEMGLSLGLFAVFGILRYRTEAMRIRDLTYLFVVIGLAILNGVASHGDGLARVVLIDMTILAVVGALELGHKNSHEETVNVRYDRVDLLRADKREVLLADLSQRLGALCKRVVVESVDLMHDSAELVVTYQTTASTTETTRHAATTTPSKAPVSTSV